MNGGGGLLATAGVSFREQHHFQFGMDNNLLRAVFFRRIVVKDGYTKGCRLKHVRTARIDAEIFVFLLLAQSSFSLLRLLQTIGLRGWGWGGGRQWSWEQYTSAG